MDCPFHGNAHLSSCSLCRRAKRRAAMAQQNARRSNDRAERRIKPNRPPPTEQFYIDHPERNTAEDIVAIMKTMVREFGGRA